ncbi:MAG TPA: ABC transporter permease [Solirubrobacteraceae bacterium]|jgi:peptide/nickel transport system permease protein|nr:ABC transporter permease [Solirubrobacteraceae bacterium]
MSTAVALQDVGLPGATVDGGQSRRGLGVALWAGIAIIAVAVLATVFVRITGVGNPDQLSLVKALEAPSLSHPFGTDALGRDVFVRTVYATGLDLQVGLVTTIVPLVIGMVLGLVSGFFGGWVDAVVMRVMDALLAFPFIVLIIAFVTIFGVGLTGVYVGLTIASLPVFARLTRGEMLVLREQQFMMASRTLGYSNRRIIFKHALPHLIRPNLIYSPSNMLGNVLTLAALSYLGLGAQPPTPEWGAIIAGGQDYLLTSWWISTLPGIFVVIVGIGFSLTGEGLAELLRARTG